MSVPCDLRCLLRQEEHLCCCSLLTGLNNLLCEGLRFVFLTIEFVLLVHKSLQRSKN